MQIQYELLTDPQWEVIREKLPTQRKRKYDLRDIVNAIFWILRTGSHGVALRWRNLPKAFPKWQLVYYYFSKWKKDGTLLGLISFAGAPGAIVGGVYFGANMITIGVTGRSIGDHASDYLDIWP